jgi:hypothetical protein
LLFALIFLALTLLFLPLLLVPLLLFLLLLSSLPEAQGSRSKDQRKAKQDHHRASEGSQYCRKG